MTPADLNGCRDTILIEGALLDEARWDEWLALYADDACFWVPAWRADGTLVEDPAREVSHIYCNGRPALEDRVHRVRSGQSLASTPLPRTTHILGAIRPIMLGEGKEGLRASWSVHVYNLRSQRTATFFGYCDYLFSISGEHWRIAFKRAVIHNDNIPTMIDFYFV